MVTSDRFLALQDARGPKIIVVPDTTVSIGYTVLGPIFNLNVAVSSERKDAILDKIEVVVRHEDGAEHVFTWSQLQEEGFEMSNLEGERVDMRRRQPAIALMASRTGLVEKFVLFQESRFQEAKRPYFNSLLTHSNFLKSHVEKSADKVVGSEQFHSLIELYRQEFWWQAGNYSFKFRITSPKRVSLREREYCFNLQQHEVDGLISNVEDIKNQFFNAAHSDCSDYEPKTTTFNWFDVEVSKA